MDRPCILIIDDDISRRESLADVMCAEGYEVLAAGSGAEGLSLLQMNAVDLSFISFGLTDVPGFDVLKKAKADYPSMEAIILAGRSMIDSAVEAVNQGAFFYLVEPCEIGQMLILARQAIEKQQSRELLRKAKGESRRFKEQLSYQSNYDGLTELPNRNLLADRLNQDILSAKRYNQHVAVLFIDLDHFKFVNDSLGHDKGDQLLKIVAERLKNCMRAADTVAHYGGDEFVIVASELEQERNAANVAYRILEGISRTFVVGDDEIIITCSIGISVYPKDGEDARTLLKNADVAMHYAKEEGCGTFRFFTRELNEQIVARMTMEKHLRRALERDEFLLHFQPEVDLVTGRIAGVEALLRWQSPELGMVSPGRFIPLAEETGLIVPIGEWVLRTACAQNRAWQDAGFPPLVMAVNLSPRQFRQESFGKTVARILNESGLEPHCLELEIVESMVMQDMEKAAAILADLKSLGVRLAMDDFGTGYSSLSYLRCFPFDKLKIDMSFVRDITSVPESAVIARTIIAMAHSLNLRVIAEGVETESQLGYLRVHECDGMQGFLFSQPVPAHDFEQLLRDDKRLQFPDRILLLVDDEAYVIAALERVLSNEGYRIVSAYDAAKGFEQLAVNRVGVIVCDQRMPEMNGTEFLNRVKELYPDTVRIVLTGYADLDTVTDAVNRGAIYKFLTKPWDEKFLLESIGEAFRYYELARRKNNPEEIAQLAEPAFSS